MPLPTVVLVDSSPLIHLAMIGGLDLTLSFGPVFVPDAVTASDLLLPLAGEG